MRRLTQMIVPLNYGLILNSYCSLFTWDYEDIAYTLYFYDF